MKTKEKMVQRTILLAPAEMRKLEQIVEQSVTGYTLNDVVRAVVAQVPSDTQLTTKGLRKVPDRSKVTTE